MCTDMCSIHFYVSVGSLCVYANILYVYIRYVYMYVWQICPLPMLSALLWRSVMQRNTTCCSVLRCTSGTCARFLCSLTSCVNCVAIRYSVLHGICVAACSSVLQCVAVRCRVLRYGAVCFSVMYLSVFWMAHSTKAGSIKGPCTVTP